MQASCDFGDSPKGVGECCDLVVWRGEISLKRTKGRQALDMDGKKQRSSYISHENSFTSEPFQAVDKSKVVAVIRDSLRVRS